jgi:hypothetical protein
MFLFFGLFIVKYKIKILKLDWTVHRAGNNLLDNIPQSGIDKIARRYQLSDIFDGTPLSG